MSKVRIIKYNLSRFILYFISYSFIGWCIETVYMSVKTGGFVKRGFLLGPFCPIYGFCALFLIIILSPFKERFVGILAVSIFVPSFLEYITGYILRNYFNLTLWDYSDELLNINGWVCPKFTIIWAFFSMLLIYFLHPFMQNMFFHLPHNYKLALSCITAAYFIIDTSTSALLTLGFGKNIKVNLNISDLYNDFEFIIQKVTVLISRILSVT